MTMASVLIAAWLLLAPALSASFCDSEETRCHPTAKYR
jgi:hypothetical protein